MELNLKQTNKKGWRDKNKDVHLKLRGQNMIDPFMGSISFNPYRGQINHDLGHFL